jgi:WD40 repeat protein
MDPATRHYLLQTRAAMTERAGRDIRSLCLDPRWLLSSITTRPVAQVAEDLARGGDPELVRLGKFLERGAHMVSEARSKAHRINTMLAWLGTEPHLRPVVERCVAQLRRPYLRTLWSMAPSGTERTRTLRRHHAMVIACTFSVHGELLTTADRKGVVMVWDVATGAFVGEADPRRFWAEQGHAESPGPSSGGRIRVSYGFPQVRLLSGACDHLAVLTPEGLLGVWSLDGVPSPRWVLDTQLDGDPATFLLRRDDPETFLTRSDEAFRLRSWATGDVLLTMPLDGQMASSCLDEDDRVFAVEADQGLVDVWDLTGRRHAARLWVGGRDIARLAVDGALLFVADSAGTGRVWDWTCGRQLTTVRGVFDLPQVDSRAGSLRWLRRPGHLAVVPIRTGSAPMTGVGAWLTSVARGRPRGFDDYGFALEVRLSEQVLATVTTRTHENDDQISYEHRVDMFDRRTGQVLMSGWGADEVLTVAKGPRPDQAVVVTTSGRVETWDLAAGGMRHCRTATSFNDGLATAVSPDGSCVAVCVESDVHLVRPSEKDAAAYPLIGNLLDVTADPGGRWLATLTDQLELDIWDPGTWRLRHRRSGTATRTFHSNMPFRAFSPDGRWIAIHDWDDSLLVWDAMSGQPLPGLRSQDADLVHVAAGPHGPVTVIRHQGGQLSVWDVATRRRMAVLPPSTTVVGDIRGRWVAGIGPDAQVFVWDLALARPLPSPGTAAVVAADPAGRWLYVLGDRTLTAVNPATGRNRLLRMTDGTGDDVAVTVVPSRDGEKCAVIRRDGGIEMLSCPENGSTRAEPVARTRLAGRENLLWRLSASGRLMAIADSGTGSLELIDLTASATAARARASATLDGSLREMAWLGDTAVAVIGPFGLQLITLAPPAPGPRTSV